MEWWGWALIGIGAAAAGWLKLSLFKKMRSRRAKAARFEDGD